MRFQQISALTNKTDLIYGQLVVIQAVNKDHVLRHVSQPVHTEEMQLVHRQVFPILRVKFTLNIVKFTLSNITMKDE